MYPNLDAFGTAIEFGSESWSMELAVLEAKYISIMVVIQFS